MAASAVAVRVCRCTVIHRSVHVCVSSHNRCNGMCAPLRISGGRVFLGSPAKSRAECKDAMSGVTRTTGSTLSVTQA